jgi:SanA protein
MKLFKRIVSISILLLLVCIAVLWIADIYITKHAEGKIFSTIDQTPSVRTGLLLGTSKYLRNGYINHYFVYRIEAATELFKSGKIQYIVISGDNSRSTYDEPTDMKNELIKNGIDSTKIYLDYAGFRTFDSVVRVKEIFSQDSILIISQKFHNERALYIADKLTIKAYGYNAKDVTTKYGIKTIIREKFARVKVILDFIFGVKPKFLGEKIKIQ